MNRVLWLRIAGWVLTALGGALLLFLGVTCLGLTQAPEWASPWAFLLLLPALALPFRPWLMGQNRLAVPSFASVRTGFSLRVALSWLPRAMEVVALFLLVVALARPRLTQKETIRKTDGLDILLAIDTSGSMEAEDLSVMGQAVNRLQVAKGVVAEFIEHRPNDRIGVVVFGEEAFTHVPLTLDHDTLLRVLDQVEIGIAGSRGTAIGSAIAVSTRRLEQVEAKSKLVILLTDGQSNAGRIEPLEAAKLAQAVNVKVYTIGVGRTDGGTGMPFFPSLFQMDGVDEKTLTAVAKTTDGRYFRAQSADSLRKIYDTIDELEPSPAEVREVAHYVEWYRRALFPGILLWIGQLLLSATWLRRGP